MVGRPCHIPNGHACKTLAMNLGVEPRDLGVISSVLRHRATSAPLITLFILIRHSAFQVF